LKVSTRAKAERISRFAFDFALKNNRKVSSLLHSYLRPLLRKHLIESHLRTQSEYHETR
jgi:isocitrate/isopropylmalate dehydrogenase